MASYRFRRTNRKSMSALPLMASVMSSLRSILKLAELHRPSTEARKARNQRRTSPTFGCAALFTDCSPLASSEHTLASRVFPALEVQKPSRLFRL
jgi:hypothetical protein